MNNKGIGSGLAIILILIVALLIAFLVIMNVGNFVFGNKPSQSDGKCSGSDTGSGGGYQQPYTTSV